MRAQNLFGPFTYETPGPDPKRAFDFGGTWGWDQTPWPLWCLVCWERDEHERKDCPSCANTRRVPIPFEEMWGL